jgi:chromosomal replication initiation ATPase DnaA
MSDGLDIAACLESGLPVFLSERHAPVLCKAPAREIVERVAQARGVTVRELYGSSRVGRVARARQAAMLALHQTGRYSLSEIGRLLGRHHTSVMHGVKAAARRAARA